MALSERRGSESGSDSEEELEELESEVKQMAQKILEYRATIPDQLKNTLASVLEAQRPILPDGLDPGTSGAPNSDAGLAASNKGAVMADEDQTLEKIRLLKEKASSNVAAMPIVLKRVKESVSKIEKLDSQSKIIHPAFKRGKTS